MLASTMTVIRVLTTILMNWIYSQWLILSYEWDTEKKSKDTDTTYVHGHRRGPTTGYSTLSGISFAISDTKIMNDVVGGIHVPPTD